MATFKAIVRTNKEQNAVYIRISHHGKPDYIKTSMIALKSDLRKGKIEDSEILVNCALKIKKYIGKIKNAEIANWTVKELKNFLFFHGIKLVIKNPSGLW